MRPIDLPVLIISAALFVLVYGFVSMARSAIKAHCALNKARWSCQKMSAKLRDVTCAWDTASKTFKNSLISVSNTPAHIKTVGDKIFLVMCGDVVVRRFCSPDPDTNKRMAEELTLKLNQQP